MADSFNAALNIIYVILSIQGIIIGTVIWILTKFHSLDNDKVSKIGCKDVRNDLESRADEKLVSQKEQNKEKFGRIESEISEIKKTITEINLKLGSLLAGRFDK